MMRIRLTEDWFGKKTTIVIMEVRMSMSLLLKWLMPSREEYSAFLMEKES